MFYNLLTTYYYIRNRFLNSFISLKNSHVTNIGLTWLNINKSLPRYFYTIISLKNIHKLTSPPIPFIPKCYISIPLKFVCRNILRQGFLIILFHHIYKTQNFLFILKVINIYGVSFSVMSLIIPSSCRTVQSTPLSHPLISTSSKVSFGIIKNRSKAASVLLLLVNGLQTMSLTF